MSMHKQLKCNTYESTGFENIIKQCVLRPKLEMTDEVPGSGYTTTLKTVNKIRRRVQRSAAVAAGATAEEAYQLKGKWEKISIYNAITFI